VLLLLLDGDFHFHIFVMGGPKGKTGGEMEKKEKNKIK
jgi:hypothetical protein